MTWPLMGINVMENARPLISRRSVLATGALTLAGAAFPAPCFGAADTSLASLERRHGGRLGLFALDLQSSRALSHRADERFKVYSTFKVLLAALVLSDVAGSRETLDATVSYGKGNLMAASPVTKANVARGEMTVREMCEAMMFRSDNTAANLLMARCGGPGRLTEFLRAIGDPVTRVDSYEGQVDGKPPDFDTTTPRAVVATLRALLLGPTLSVAARRQLEDWLVGNQVGGSRLRAAFPTSWRTGDRTGTGDGYCNDLAIATRPGKAPLIVGAYYHAQGMRPERQEAVLREAGLAVVAWQAAPG